MKTAGWLAVSVALLASTVVAQSQLASRAVAPDLSARLARFKAVPMPFDAKGLTPPPGHGLYPADLTRQAVEAYVAAHPERKAAIDNPYTVVHREGADLVGRPYHEEFRALLMLARAELGHAATLSPDPAFARRNGQQVDIREAIGATYSGLEEAKADVVGMLGLKWLVDRTVRFGTGEAHGRAEMMEFNYLIEQGAIARMPAELKTALARANDVPVDIDPIFSFPDKMQ